MPLELCRRSLRLFVPLVFVAAFAGAFEVAAQAPEDERILDDEPTQVIQNRRYNLGTEFSVIGGVLPLDPFYRSLHAGGRLSVHLGPHHAIEAGGLYTLNVPTSLRDQLRDNFAIDDNQPGVEQPLFLIDGGYVIKPLYGKLSLFNRSLLYNELYLTIGGASAGYRRDQLLLLFGPGGGGGVRIYLNDFFSVRIDLRHYILFGTAFNNVIQEEEFLVENVMNFSMGISLNFGGGR